MIRSPLPRVSEGQILDLNLANNIIKRTEYAADLLRQYKILSGKNITISQEIAGTRISSGIPKEQQGQILCGYYGLPVLGIIGFTYQSGVFTEIPSPSIGTEFDDSYFGISENTVVGSITAGFPETYGLTYKNGQFNYYRYKNQYTQFFSIRKGQIVGEVFDETIEDPVLQQRAVYLNLNTGQFSDYVFPYSSYAINGYRTIFQDIYETKIVGDYAYLKPGGQSTSVGSFIFENGNWTQLNYPDSFYSSIFTIYENTIIGLYRFSAFGETNIYIYENGQFTTNAFLTSLGISYAKLKGRKLAGTMGIGSERQGFVYDLDTEEFSTIQHPNQGTTGTYITGID